jgi:hypothetical protein
MKRKPTFATLVVGLAWMTSISLAQTGDWDAVESLPPETEIHVTLKHGRVFGHCRFQQASDDQLTCRIRRALPTFGTPFPSIELVYGRDEIRAVYTARNGAAIGTAVGAGTGAIIGTARDPVPGLNRGGTALVNAAVLGGVGMAIGAILDPFFHGKAVYLCPDASGKKRRNGPRMAKPGQSRNDKGVPAARRQEPLTPSFASDVEYGPEVRLLMVTIRVRSSLIR